MKMKKKRLLSVFMVSFLSISIFLQVPTANATSVLSKDIKNRVKSSEVRQQEYIDKLMPIIKNEELGNLRRPKILSQSEIVNIPDENLRKVINKQLGKGEITNEITKNEMETLISVNIENLNFVSSIEGLQYATNLKNLIIRESYSLYDLKPISELRKLETIFVSESQVTDIDPIAKIESLKEVWFYNTNISDIKAVSKLINLESLMIENSSVSNISPIANLKKLRDLSFEGNNVRNINAISDKTTLINLWLGKNIINDITPIQNLINLDNIQLGNNKISNISVIQNFNNLFILVLENNIISDIKVLGSENLNTLKSGGYISLDGNNISDFTPLSEYSIPEYDFRIGKQTIETKGIYNSSRKTLEIKNPIINRDGSLAEVFNISNRGLYVQDEETIFWGSFNKSRASFEFKGKDSIYGIVIVNIK